MKRLATMTPGIVSFVFCCWVLFGVVSPAQSATKTDTFQLKMTGKRWCVGNPNFSELFTVKINLKDPSTNSILTIKRDPQNTGDLTDIEATIDTHGGSAELDAIILRGKVFQINKSGNKAEFALSGVNPANTDHFVTIRGQMTFDKLDNLTKVTGSFMWWETSTYTIDKKTGAQSGQVECINSGTSATTRTPAGLIVRHAPANVGGTFVANARPTGTIFPGNLVAGVAWAEGAFNPGQHVETIQLNFDNATQQVIAILFSSRDNTVQKDWVCGFPSTFSCAGATVNRTAGTFTVVDAELRTLAPQSYPPITLKGTLNFVPF